jgi:hypothetical protein
MDKNYYPAKPSFKALTTAERERVFGKFKYESTGGGNIRILGNWVAENIVKVKIPQLIGIPGAPKDGVIQWHKKGVAQIKGFFQAVEDAGLLHLIISWAGSYNARFIRGSKTSLSNHAWATAFDINAPENWLGAKPAAIGKKGSLLQLVEIAHQFGFFWGGHFTRLDGMHFELAVLDKFPAVQTSPVQSIPVQQIPVVEPVLVQPTIPAAENPPVEGETTKTETILQKVESVGNTVQSVSEKITNVSSSVSPISKSSVFMTITTKAAGWMLLVVAFVKDNWLELLIAFGLIALAVWYFSRAKDRANERAK